MVNESALMNVCLSSKYLTVILSSPISVLLMSEPKAVYIVQHLFRAEQLSVQNKISRLLSFANSPFGKIPKSCNPCYRHVFIFPPSNSFVCLKANLPNMEWHLFPDFALGIYFNIVIPSPWITDLIARSFLNRISTFHTCSGTHIGLLKYCE